MSALRIKSVLLAAVLLAFGVLQQLPNTAQETQNQRLEELIPFFDNEDNPVPLNFPSGQQLDISLPVPKLNAFDEAVLKACGLIGSNVLPNQFKSLLRKYPNVLEKIQRTVGGSIRPGRKRRSDF